MVTIPLVVLSFLLAFLRGGRLNRDIPGIWYPVVGVLVQVSLSHLFPGTLLGRMAVVLGYLSVLPFLWLNRRSQGLALAALGLLLNLAVITANGGLMPVDNELAAARGITVAEGELAKHQPMGPDTRLALLGDVIPVPPIPTLFSIGDLLLDLGAFLFIQEAMGLTLRRWRPHPG